MRRFLHEVWNILTAGSMTTKNWPHKNICATTWLTALNTLHLPVRLQLQLLQILLFQALLRLLVHLGHHRWQLPPTAAVLDLQT